MNNNEINSLINSFIYKNGFNKKQTANDKNKQKVEKLMKNLNSNQTEQLKQILSDPEKTSKILNSSAAKALIKKLSDNG